jgi:hypothetical protein
MIKKAILVILNLFNFHKPSFVVLEYADFVISNKAFFLVSWKIERGYKLSIPGLHFSTYKSSGSAYIAVPDHIDQLELVISNFWKSGRKNIALISQTIHSQVDFFPVKQFEELTAASMYMPQINPDLKTPQPGKKITDLHLPSFSIQTINLTRT